MQRKNNAFNKYLTKEDRLHVLIAEWISWQYPKVVWIHPPNEGKRTPFEQFLFKCLGARSGASDIIFFCAKAGFHGLAIELKVNYDKGKNYPTKHQKAFLKDLNKEGYCTAVTWTFEETKDIITNYMNDKIPDIKYKY